MAVVPVDQLMSPSSKGTTSWHMKCFDMQGMSIAAYQLYALYVLAAMSAAARRLVIIGNMHNQRDRAVQHMGSRIACVHTAEWLLVTHHTCMGSQACNAELSY